MSLYSEYLKERTNDQILEINVGFATYRYLDSRTCYIVDIFIRPQSRNIGLASELADKIVKEAKEKGCTELIGTIQPSAKGSMMSLRVLLAYGFELKSAEHDIIVLRKDI